MRFVGRALLRGMAQEGRSNGVPPLPYSNEQASSERTCRKRALAHPDIVLSGVLEQQQNVGQAHQLANALAQVDQFEAAAGYFG